MKEKVIEKIEIIKITPQIYAGEAVSPLVQDPWKTIPCQGTGECIVEFEDQNFSRDSCLLCKGFTKSYASNKRFVVISKRQF
jgi:hypothetical protein